MNIHVLGLGNAGRKHVETIKSMPELYTLSAYEDADNIGICTPNHLHYDQAVEALTAGKDVILEKPFCATLAQFDRLLSLEVELGRTVYPMLQYRNTPMHTYSATWQRPSDYYAGWRGNPALAFGGVIMSHGVHLIDHAIARHGSVATLSCKTWSDPRYACDVETEARIMLMFETDDLVTIHLEIAPDRPQSAPANPGYKDMFMSIANGTAPTLASHRETVRVIEQCYRQAALAA